MGFISSIIEIPMGLYNTFVLEEKFGFNKTTPKTFILDKLKGWILDIMKCIDKLEKNEFTLDEMYSFENLLSQKYTNNKHIKDKIRQQLQFLRDKGYLEFISKGKYKLI